MCYDSLSTQKHYKYGNCMLVYSSKHTRYRMLKATQPSRYLGTANAYFTTDGSGCAQMIVNMRFLKAIGTCLP